MILVSSFAKELEKKYEREREHDSVGKKERERGKGREGEKERRERENKICVEKERELAIKMKIGAKTWRSLKAVSNYHATYAMTVTILTNRCVTDAKKQRRLRISDATEPSPPPPRPSRAYPPRPPCPTTFALVNCLLL